MVAYKNIPSVSISPIPTCQVIPFRPPTFPLRANLRQLEKISAGIAEIIVCAFTVSNATQIQAHTLTANDNEITATAKERRKKVKRERQRQSHVQS